MPATETQKKEITDKIDGVKKTLEDLQKKGINKVTDSEKTNLETHIKARLFEVEAFIRKHDVTNKYNTALKQFPTKITENVKVFKNKTSAPAAWTKSITEVVHVFNELRSAVKDKAL